MYAVEPRRDCPHVHSLDFESFSKKDIKIDAPCEKEGCGKVGENWICCFCGTILCSRYIAGHAAEHAEKEKDHCIAVSFADCSCWCYKCDDYIDDAISRKFVQRVQRAKFGGPKDEAAAAPKITEELKENVLKDVDGGILVVKGTKLNEAVLFRNCSNCIIDVSSPVGILRLIDCKNCTVSVKSEITTIDIQKCLSCTVWNKMTCRKTSLFVNDSAAIVVKMKMDPKFFFFALCKVTNSVVGFVSEKKKCVIPKGPCSTIEYDRESDSLKASS